MMQSLFAPVDTLDGSNFLRAVHSTDGSVIENFIMPVNSFQKGGEPVTVNGYGQRYDLFLTVEAALVNNQFTTLNAELWADPGSNNGSVTVSEHSDPAFTNGIHGDILLATGTKVSASLSFDPNTGIRTADFVETMTPTRAGTFLLGGTIHDGTKLEEHLTTPPSTFRTFNETDGTVINTVTGGQSEITLNPVDTILLPSVPPSAIHLSDAPKFIHR